MREPIRPSVWRSAKRNTALRVRAVRIARGEYQGCPPPGRAGFGRPRSDRLSGEPDCQAPTLTQAGVIGRPVRDLVLLPWDVVAAGLVQLEGQEGHPWSDEGRSPTPPRLSAPTDPPADPCNTAHGYSQRRTRALLPR